MTLKGLQLTTLLLALSSFCRAKLLEGTDREAEFLSAATRNFQNERTISSAGLATTVNEGRQAGSPIRSNSSAVAFANQVTNALSQLDLGLGIYKMCPFPFSYLHQCDGSSDCPDSDCCGMYAFPGPNRWRRSCCVPDGVTTIARVARLCIKGNDNKNAGTNNNSGSSRPLSASSVFQDVVAQALGVNTSNSDSDFDIDDDDDVKKL